MVGDVVARLQVIPVLHNPAAHRGNALQRYAGREHLLNQTERSGIDIVLLHDGICSAFGPTIGSSRKGGKGFVTMAVGDKYGNKNPEEKRFRATLFILA